MVGIFFGIHDIHRRMINTEEMAKVVAPVLRTDLLQFLAAQAILHQDDQKNKMQSSFSSNHPGEDVNLPDALIQAHEGLVSLKDHFMFSFDSSHVSRPRCCPSLATVRHLKQNGFLNNSYTRLGALFFLMQAVQSVWMWNNKNNPLRY